MSDMDYNDEGPPIFDDKEIKSLIDKVVEPVLGNAIYQPKKVNDWTNTIVESVLKNLAAANKPFKYVVTCVVMQRNGTELNISSASFWDPKSDNSCCVRWDNPTMHVVVSVFALRL